MLPLGDRSLVPETLEQPDRAGAGLVLPTGSPGAEAAAGGWRGAEQGAERSRLPQPRGDSRHRHAQEAAAGGSSSSLLGISRGSPLPFAPGASRAGVGGWDPIPRVFPVL